MDPPPSSLLSGPPEARHLRTQPEPDKEQPFLHAAPPQPINNAPFMPPRGFTENNSMTYLSSGNPCLDYFFQVVPNTPPHTVVSLLASAWAHDPLKALKLVCHLRGVRGTGKSDREGFYASALWLHTHHTLTLALNVPSLADFGYIKDLLEILLRLLDGFDTRSTAKEARNQNKRKRNQINTMMTMKKNKKQKRKKKIGTREERIAADLARAKLESETAAKERHSKRNNQAARLLTRYETDARYRFLHDRIADFFAERLASDIATLGKEARGISLAAKWCPSLNSSFDRSTFLCESIARRMFPKDRDPAYADLSEEHYAYRARIRLRSDVLVPLRKALELPEVYMSDRRWDSLPYNRVASVAMKNYTKIFLKHDKDRFQEYLADVEEGKTKIAAGALFPHEIIASLDENKKVAELQWQRMVQDLLEKGQLKNCIAVCDVSGSMAGMPMDVCVALGLLVSELSEPPWKGRVITFSSNPQLHKIEGKSLKKKTKFIKKMEWGMNTDFQKVFDRILDVAVRGKLEKDKMIKRIFVFSDMEFDQASTSRDWGTDYDVICKKFERRGYGDCVPEIVFWNLRDSRSTPVPSTQKGVALVSGFSKNILKIFLEGGAVFSPEAIMDDAISGKEYQNLVVFD